MTVAKSGEPDAERPASDPPVLGELWAVRAQIRLAQVSRGIDLATRGLAAVLLCFLSIVLFLQVTFRYVLQQPLPWSEEAARFALVWFGMMAAAAGARRGLHFVFRWGTLFVPERPRRWLRQGVNALVLTVLGVIVFESVRYLDIVANQTAMATSVNMRVPYAGVPLGLGCLCLIYALDLADGVLETWTHRTFSAREIAERVMFQQLTDRPNPGLDTRP